MSVLSPTVGKKAQPPCPLLFISNGLRGSCGILRIGAQNLWLSHLRPLYCPAFPEHRGFKNILNTPHITLNVPVCIHVTTCVAFLRFPNMWYHLSFYNPTLYPWIVFSQCLGELCLLKAWIGCQYQAGAFWAITFRQPIQWHSFSLLKITAD